MTITGSSITRSCPVCDPRNESNTLTVRVTGESRRSVDAEVIGCARGCKVTIRQRTAVEQEVIDEALAGVIR